jgi:hypothetical protein
MRCVNNIASLPCYFIKASIIFWSPGFPSFAAIAPKTSLSELDRVLVMNLYTADLSSSFGNYIKSKVTLDIPSSGII